MKKILGLIIVLVIFYFSPKPVSAADEFSTSYDVSYEIGTDGIASVTEKISLKNLTSQYYASNFTLSIGSTTVTDVSASDGSGPMETKLDNGDSKDPSGASEQSSGTFGKTSITVKFNQQIVGINKAQTFMLKYKSKDFASSLGETWEVNLPKVPNASNITSYNLILSVPISFGDPTSIAPVPKSESQSFDKQTFQFDKNQLLKSGVSVNFGSTQGFDFNLKYHLENSSLFPVMTSVALPPDTQYQDIMITRITPEPLNVTVDEDGNYLAWYRLNRRSKQDIAVAGAARLYISSKNKKVPLLPVEKTRTWVKSDSYWEKDNPGIAAAISEIFKEGMPSSNKEKARLIYRYVVDTLKYDANRLNNSNIERLGAVTSLNNPNSAVCMEFTDLFIALARAADIPARELDGFAYSENKNLRPLTLSRDLLHAWPEYYDENIGWVMVDPTWENTSGGVDYFNKFDLNHLVLAIKGVSSKTPFTSDDVKVTVSTGDFIGNPKIDVSIDVPEVIWAGLPSTVSVKVLNQGNTAQGSSALSIKAGTINILGDKVITLGTIPPFGSTSYQFNLRSPSIWQGTEDVVEVNVAGKVFTKKVLVKPFFLMQEVPYLFIGGVVVILGIYGLVLGSHIHFRSRVRSDKAVDKEGEKNFTEAVPEAAVGFVSAKLHTKKAAKKAPK